MQLINCFSWSCSVFSFDIQRLEPLVDCDSDNFQVSVSHLVMNIYIYMLTIGNSAFPVICLL